jgi:hypothetical protein
VDPVDERRPYKVVENGVEHTYLLDDADAEAAGLKQAKAPANKQAPKPKNK